MSIVHVDGRVVVKTQQELDAALAIESNDLYEILIDSPRGVWIELDSRPRSPYASVSASGSASVSASGSASVRASGSASVSAWGSASVSAWDSASVSAWGSASVSASGSASVRAWGSASVSASKHVAVHLHSQCVTVQGGVVIDVTDFDLAQTADWIDYKGVEQPTPQTVLLFKCVDGDLAAGHGYRPTTYAIGTEVVAPDWKANNYCGSGLHFSAHPHEAEVHFSPKVGDTRGPRFLAVEVALTDLITLDAGKVKARACRVLHEVDVHGRMVEAPAVSRGH